VNFYVEMTKPCPCGFGCWDGVGCMGHDDEFEQPTLRPNGIRVQHIGERGTWEGGNPSEFARWVCIASVPTRVRVCRGSRR
jgi:hypothetical protein